MKKVIIAASCFALFAACSSNTNSEYDKYYEGNEASTTTSAEDTDSVSGARVTAASRQSEVDTNRMNIGTDRTTSDAAPTGAAATTAGTTTAATPSTGAASTTAAATTAGSTTGGTTAASTAAKPKAATSGATAQQANFDKGKKLIETSDCLACHKVEDKLVGPSYKEVADKYEMNDKNVTYLAQKIVKGGSGVWGQIPMSPHPDLSEGDAKEMAKYILSLK